MRSPEQSYSQFEDSKKGISRRNFLKGAGALTTTAVVGFGAPDGNPSHVDVDDYRYDSQKADDLLANLEPEQIEGLGKIREYRIKLGLTPYPKTILESVIKGNTEWQFASDPFKNELPETLYSYGMLNEHLQNSAFGENAGRLVRRIQVNPNSPNEFSFLGSSTDRVCTIGYNTSIHPLDSYGITALHEAIGHGSDPSDNSLLYPLPLLIDVEKGRAQMLSQAFDIEGQFYNHPNDLMYPLLKRKMGELIANRSYKGNLSEVFEGEIAPSVAKNIIHAECETQGPGAEELKFNKRMCERLGELFIDHNRSGAIPFSPEVKKVYTTQLESSLKEIYAEMVRLTLMDASLVENNNDIINGLTTVLSAIQGKDIDLEKVRSAMSAIPQEVVDRREMEVEWVAALLPKPPLHPEFGKSIGYDDNPQFLRARQQNTNFVRQVDAFTQFVSEGKLPDGVKSSYASAVCLEFAQARSAIEGVYPFLKTVTNPSLDSQFDPNLHIWEIHEVEGALANSYVRSLLTKLAEKPFEIDVAAVSQKTKILNKFIESPAFGS